LHDLLLARDASVLGAGSQNIAANAVFTFWQDSDLTIPYILDPNAVAVPASIWVKVTNPTTGCFGKALFLLTLRPDCGGHIFPTNTTCDGFKNGAPQQVNLCINKSGVATPGVIFYYSSVTPTTANFTFELQQTNDGRYSKLMKIHGYPAKTQLHLWSPTCTDYKKVSYTFNATGTGVTFTVTGATPGATYVVSVKYDVNSLNGGTFTAGETSSTFTFKGLLNGVENAAYGDTIDLVKGCDASIVAKTADVSLNDVQTVGFDAYPVPFRDQLTIRYNFDYTSDVKIELFNAQGVLLLSKEDARGYYGKEYTLNLNLRQDQMYVIKVTTDRGTSFKKVFSSR